MFSAEMLLRVDLMFETHQTHGRAKLQQKQTI